MKYKYLYIIAFSIISVILVALSFFAGINSDKEIINLSQDIGQKGNGINATGNAEIKINNEYSSIGNVGALPGKQQK